MPRLTGDSFNPYSPSNEYLSGETRTNRDKTLEKQGPDDEKKDIRPVKYGEYW